MIKPITGEELRSKIGHNLTTIRTWKNEKQDAVAKSVNISAGTLSKIETGHYDALTVDLLVAICNHYNFPLQLVLDLGFTTVNHNSQIIETGASFTADKNVINEVTGGYEVAIQTLKDELVYYKTELAKVRGEK